MDTSLNQRLKNLTSSDTTLLSVLEELRHMKDEGFEQEVVRSTLEDIRKESLTESEEDRILEVLDFVTGFCPPEKQVWEN
ncbi:MAG: hypothetical protein ACFCD0_30135 [Gemmataceae bacterium]